MCFSILPDGKDWIDLFIPLMTLIIAGIGVYIAHHQFAINKNRLKLELYPYRYAVFEAIAGHLAHIVIKDEIGLEANFKFMRDTKSAELLFDEDIKQLVDQIYKKSIVFEGLKNDHEHGIKGELLEKNMVQKTEITTWFSETLRNIDERFIKYLKLEH